MLTKFAARLLIFTIALGIGLIVVTEQRSNAADVECSTWHELPGECLTPNVWSYIYNQDFALKEANDDIAELQQYVIDVAAAHQLRIDQLTVERDNWHDAHDRVAANLVVRNTEYAHARDRITKLQYRLDYWKQLARSRR